MSSIFIKGLCKKYDGGINVLSNFNLEVKDGELAILLGPSGSGKSTALHLISGFDEPTSGDIIINGILVNDAPPQSRNIGVIRKNQSLYPQMTVYENLEFSLKLSYTSYEDMESKIVNMSKLMGVSHLLQEKAGSLSEKDKIRVILLRSIIRNPKVLLIDNPFSKQTKELREFYRDSIIELNKKTGITTIIATTDRKLIENMEVKTILLKEGYVQQIDTAKNLYQQPINIFSADFLTFPRMDICTGKVKKDKDKFFVVVGKKTIALENQDFVLLEKYENKEVVVGLRGDSITLQNDEHEGKVTNVEETLYGEIATIESDEMSVTLLNKNNLMEGKKVKFSFVPQNVLIFDKDSEKRIY